MLASSGDYTPTTICLPQWGGGRVEIPAARDGNALFVPVGYICERILGIDKRTQVPIIKERFAEGSQWRGEVPFRMGKGWRSMFAIRTPEAALWVAGIDPRRVKAAARDPLEQFCEELKHEAERLLFGAAPRAPEPLRATVSSTVRVEVRMHCFDCGAPHYILHENGTTTVLRVRAEEE